MQLTVNGIDTFVATGGREFDKSQPTIVLLHGAGFDRSTWALHSRWFAHHGFGVLAPDLPGHGRSPPDREPPGYLEWLKQQEPEITFKASDYHTPAEWIAAGELVFNAPTSFDPVFFSAADLRDGAFYSETGMPVGETRRDEPHPAG